MAYSSLPGLHAANQSLQDKGGEDIITGPIRDLFLQHGVQDELGLALLHKHWDIQPHQRVVDIRNVSTPWETGKDTSLILSKYNGHIVPRSMRAWNEAWVPYEFEYSEKGSFDITDHHTVFLEKLSTFLLQHDLQQVLGIRLLESRDASVSVEVTEGQSNIMLPKEAVNEETLVSAMWVFGKDEDDRCNCMEYCFKDRAGKHTGGTHGCG